MQLLRVVDSKLIKIPSMVRFRLNNNITLRSWIFYTLQKIHLFSGFDSHEVLFKKRAGVHLDCEQQSLFFFRFSKGSARTQALSGEAARHEK